MPKQASGADSWLYPGFHPWEHHLTLLCSSFLWECYILRESYDEEIYEMPRLPTFGGRQGEALSMLRNAKHVLGAWEGEVKGDGLGPLGLAVCVPLERLLPPALRVALLQPLYISQAGLLM